MARLGHARRHDQPAAARAPRRSGRGSASSMRPSPTISATPSSRTSCDQFEPDRIIGAVEGDAWVGRRRWLFAPPDGARRGRGRGGRDHRHRRHAQPSTTRDPAPGHGLAGRPGGRARRAGGDPVGVRDGDLPALRLRDRHAPGDLRHRAQPNPVRASGRAAGTHAAGRSRRGAGAHPAGLRRDAATDPGSGQPARRQVAAPAARRRRVDAPRQRAQVHRGAGGRRRGPRLRHLPGQDRMGRARPEQHGHRRSRSSGSTRPPSAPSGNGCSGSTWWPTSRAGGRACRSRCCSSWPSLAGSGWPSAKACSCGSSTCPRRSRGAATTRPARSRSR